MMAKPQAIRPIKPSLTTAMLLYGPPGAGKTRLIGVPGSLIIHPPTDHVDSIRVVGADEWEVTDWAEMLNALEYMRHDAAKDYKWVWLDSISLWQDTGLDDIWEGVIGRRPDRAAWTLDKGEYGINMWRLQQWVRTAIGIPGLNIGITAHPAELMNPIDGEIKLQPWIQGKNMSTKIQGYMKIVAYLEVVAAQDNSSGAPRRVLRTAGTERYEAKDQYDAFPKGRLVDPTLKKIEDAIAAVRVRQVPKSPPRRAVAKPRPGQGGVRRRPARAA
jgi:hypothetical protein